MQELQKGNRCIVVLVKRGTVLIVKNAERKRTSLVANLGDINRPLRVRPVRVMGREWWAVDAEDTWPGMVMDLRRLGFESMAWEDEVLVREGAPAYEPQMEGPAAPGGLKPFPLIHPTIQIRKESYSPNYADFGYLDEYDDEEDEEDVEEENELEPEDLSE
jgi:hypothetical protein